MRRHRGRLQRSAPAMRLFEKAKRLGIWNPSDIDMAQDGMDWQQLDSAKNSHATPHVALPGR